MSSSSSDPSLEGRFRAIPAQGFAEDDRLGLLSPVSGELIVLEGTARRIWQKLEYPARLDEVSAALGAEYDAPVETVIAGVRSIVPRLLDEGLVARATGGSDANRDRYLRLLKRALANALYPELELQIGFLARGGEGLSGMERERYLRDIEERRPEDLAMLIAAKQEGGSPWRFPHSMIGLFRLGNIEHCAETVFAENIEGDFLEAGVCRGGATIFMRALQVAHGETDRRTWVVDSFQGVPPSDKAVDRRYDVHLDESVSPWLACSERRVRDLFVRYDMLDSNVEFVAGWLAESLPAAPIGPLAILRLDVDLYSSTYEGLDLLYDKVSPGGFVIVDDYASFDCCRDAVDDFRDRHGIVEPIRWIDRRSVYWRKGGAA
jgi:hypothetical protein